MRGESKTTPTPWVPPTKHRELMGITTMKLVDELNHRLKCEPFDTWKIWPDGFADLRHLIMEAQYAKD